MHYKISIVFLLLSLLAISCDKKVTPTTSRSAPERAQLSVAFEDSLKLKKEFELTRSFKGSESFSSSAATGRNLATSIGYSYAGEIELEDVFSQDEKIKGHLIAFRISEFDPETKKVVFSVIQYGIFSGKTISVFHDRGIRIDIHSISSDQTSP